MTAFRADLAALADLVAQLVAFDRRAESLVQELDVEVQRLHGEWTGWAASEHCAAHRQWVEGATQMRSAVRDLHSVVVTARSNYAGAAGANMRMWG